MKDIESKLKEKYDEVEVPSYMFDTSRVFKRVEEEKKQRNIKIISAIACIIVLLLLTTVIITLPKLIDDKQVTIEKTGKNETKDISGKIVINSSKTIIDIADSVYVLTLKVDSIEEYTMINNVPYTRVKATIIKNYLGILNKQIELYIPGGIFKARDIKDNIKEEIDNIKSYDDEELVEILYYKTTSIPLAEENKTYITTLKEVNGEYFVDIDKTYGFKEYDPETNIVKYDTGDEQLEIDKYLENINI